MTAPVEYKSIKVSPETHRLIHDLAAEMGGSADTALAHLLATSTVRVPLTPHQYDRWKAKASETGVDVAEFVRNRIEAALLYGTDPGAIGLMYRNIEALCVSAGIKPAKPPARRNPSTQGRTPS
jgi:hypothetical protein